MDLLEDMLEGLAGGAGWAVGIAAAFIYGPQTFKGLRQVAKRAIQGYMTVSEKVRTTMAEQVEQFQDLYAEAQSEYETDKGGESAAAEAPGARRAAGTRRNGGVRRRRSNTRARQAAAIEAATTE